MKNILTICIPGAVALFMFTGCAHVITPTEEAAFAAKEHAQSFGHKSSLPPTSASRVALKAGQWVTVAMHLRDSAGGLKAMSITKYKVIDVKPTVVTLEIETQSATSSHPMVMGYVIKNYPTLSRLGTTAAAASAVIDQMQFERIITKTGTSAPVEMPPVLVGMMKDRIKDVVFTGYMIGTAKTEACSSDTLTSMGCMVYDFQSALAGNVLKGRVYAHSAIPLVGFIKENTDQSESRVLSYGYTGAKSILF